MYIIIMINIIYIIKKFKTIKIIYIFNIINIVNKNIYINNNIEFTFEYRLMGKICR